MVEDALSQRCSLVAGDHLGLVRELRWPPAARSLAQHGPDHAGGDRHPWLDERICAPAFEVDPDPRCSAVLRRGDRRTKLLLATTFEQSGPKTPQIAGSRG